MGRDAPGWKVPPRWHDYMTIGDDVRHVLFKKYISFKWQQAYRGVASTMESSIIQKSARAPLLGSGTSIGRGIISFPAPRCFGGSWTI